jgi:O-antigen/teichoic acid export membrane protein
MSRLSPTSIPHVGAIYQRALKLVLAITVPMAVGAAILAGPAIALLYGAQYHQAVGALVFLAPTIMLFPVSSLSSQLLYAQNVRRVVAMTYAVIFVENVIWNLVMIPLFSLDGAAIGTSVSELLVAGILLFFSKPLHGRLNIRRILTGVSLGSGAIAFVTALLHHYLALAIPLGIFAYLVVFLGHERLAFPEDFAVIRHFAARLTSLPAQPDAQR